MNRLKTHFTLVVYSNDEWKRVEPCNEKAGVGGIEKLPKFFYDENSGITETPANPPEDQYREMYDYSLNRELIQKDW